MFKSFWFSVIVWLLGVTVGFLLLASIYTGSVYIKVLVFILYLVVVSLTIYFARKIAKELNKK